MDLVNPDRIIAGDGTGEQTWQDWLTAHTLPEIDAATLAPLGTRVFIVAPHPDDEVLSAGGLMQSFTALGHALTVVAVTDGDASHPGSTQWPVDRLAAERPRETAAALAKLAPTAQVHRLGLPDGGVTPREALLADMLAPLLQPGDVVFTTWRLDGHPDHEATGRACAAACEASHATLVELPVWTWHWAQPGDPRLPWDRAAVVPMTQAQLATKRDALACFRSQLEPDPTTGRPPILPASATQRLLRPFEVVFR